MKATLAIATLVLAFSSLVQAQPCHAGNNQTTPSAASPMSEVAQGTGTVHKIDVAKGIVNLSHEPIPALKWPAMTMDLKVRDKKLLAGLKPGQTVKFGLAKEPQEYVITSLTVTKK